jgi:hypothetical protein
MEITVTLPAARGTLVFEISKQGLDEDAGDNSAEVEILLTDIGIDKDYSIVRNEDGTVTVTVVNNSAVGAENISVKVTAYSNAENVFDTLTINLEAGESLCFDGGKGYLYRKRGRLQRFGQRKKCKTFARDI